MIEAYLDKMRVDAAARPHGTRLRYMAKCRCMQCRAANSRYETERAAARRQGDWNGYVNAATAREWLRRLSGRGIGRDAVSAAADVSVTVINDVRSGKKLKIRARTERKILAVDEQCRSDHSLVSAATAWRQIDELLAGGFTKRWIARQLGRKSPALQLNKKTITAKNAADVARLYQRIQAGRIQR